MVDKRMRHFVIKSYDGNCHQCDVCDSIQIRLLTQSAAYSSTRRVGTSKISRTISIRKNSCSVNEED